MTQRNVIVHHHIFKNAGTTFERVLDENYGDKHLSFDGPFTFSHISQDQLAAIIERHPSHVAFSSHQIHLPAPSSLSFRAVPVVFVRHPLLRIRSVFLFEERNAHNDDSSENRDPLDGLEEWIKSMIAGGKNRIQICNLQTSALSRAYNLPPKRRGDDGRICFDLQAAINNLWLVPCLARAEHFDSDVASFTETLSRFDIDFTYRPRKAENVSSPDHDQPIERQLDAMKQKMSAETWEKLCWMNHQDLALYETVHEIVEQRLANGFPIQIVQ